MHREDVGVGKARLQVEAFGVAVIAQPLALPRVAHQQVREPGGPEPGGQLRLRAVVDRAVGEPDAAVREPRRSTTTPRVSGAQSKTRDPAVCRITQRCAAVGSTSRESAGGHTT